METIRIGGSGITASRVALGTWAIGGWMWGGNTDLDESIRTIRSAVERGITLVDTAPVYGFGRSEEIVGMALSGGLRERAIIATKVGLEWSDGKVWRNASPTRIRKEVEDSLRRLRTDYIDLYQVHWPDPLVPVQETAGALARLMKEGKIRAIGVSNFSAAQMAQFREAAPIHSVQPPYNLFEREADGEVLPYAAQHGIAVLCLRLPLPRAPHRNDYPRDRVQGRRPAAQRSQVPGAEVLPVPGRGGIARPLRARALWPAGAGTRGAMGARPGRHHRPVGRAPAGAARSLRRTRWGGSWTTPRASAST